MGLLLVFGVLCVIYWAVPNRLVPWRAIWPGALAATVAIGIVDYGFPLYLSTISTIGAFTTIFVFVLIVLVWFYLLAIIILGGGVLNAMRFEIHETGELSRPLTSSAAATLIRRRLAHRERLARRLGAVHRLVGGGQEVLGVVAVLGAGHHPDGHLHPRLVGQRGLGPDGLHQPPGEVGHVGRALFGRQHADLVAADAGGGVHRADRCAAPPGRSASARGRRAERPWASFTRARPFTSSASSEKRWP